MQVTGIVRHIDRLGRIVIPKSARDALELDRVNVDVDRDRIVLSRHTDRCLFGCASSDLLDFRGHRVCRPCAQLLGVLAASEADPQQGGRPELFLASASASTDQETIG